MVKIQNPFKRERKMMKPVYILSIVIFLIACQQEEKTGSPVSVSGIYPHLAMYNVRPFDGGVGETGVGAIVPWADRLWVMTYSASHPVGGADKLYELDSNLTMTVRPESIGGTHANRMIHKESGQLIMGPYFIDKDRNVRSVPSSKMSGRLTGVARHLTDPKNKVYYFAMEEGFYEVDVNDLHLTFEAIRSHVVLSRLDEAFRNLNADSFYVVALGCGDQNATVTAA